MPRFQLSHWRPTAALRTTRSRGDVWLALSSAATAQAARQLAPVRTGRLRRSIRVLPQDGPSGSQKTGVHAGAPYALFVELGTRRSRARPFLRPALDRTRRRTPELVALARRERRPS